GGSQGKQSTIEIQAAVDDAEQQLREVTGDLDTTEAALSGARAEAHQRAAEAERSLAALYESDAKISAVTEQLAQLGSAARSAEAEAERLSERRRAAEEAQDGIRREVADLEARLAAVEAEDAPAAADTTERDRAAALLA